MPIIKIQVGGELGQLSQSMRRLMNEMFQVSLPVVNMSDGWLPAVNICETPDALFVQADIAGVEAESLSLVLEGRLLRMSGQRRPLLPDGEKRFHLMEIGQGRFERLIRLPVMVDPEGTEARYEDGILTVHMPKAASVNAIKIQVD